MASIIRFLFSYPVLLIAYFIAGPVVLAGILFYSKTPLSGVPIALQRPFSEGWVQTDLQGWLVYVLIGLSIIGTGVFNSRKNKDSRRGEQIMIAGFAFTLSPLAIILLGFEMYLPVNILRLPLFGSGISTVMFLSVLIVFFYNKYVLNPTGHS